MCLNGLCYVSCFTLFDCNNCASHDMLFDMFRLTAGAMTQRQRVKETGQNTNTMRYNMKKIINGKKYDTETAEFIESYWNSLPDNDFNMIYECLYRKKTGEFFLRGEGGPFTKYSRSCGNGYCGSESLYPLSLEEAKAWIEKYADNQYEAIFGSVEE